MPRKTTESEVIADMQLVNFQYELAERLKALLEENTYYQSFRVEPFRFKSEYEFYIPGVTELWKTRYQMKSQRGEDAIQQIIRIAKRNRSKKL